MGCGKPCIFFTIVHDVCKKTLQVLRSQWYLSDQLFFELFEGEWRLYASLNQAIIGSDNGLAPGWSQAIIWNNGGILLIGPLGTKLK